MRLKRLSRASLTRLQVAKNKNVRIFLSLNIDYIDLYEEVAFRILLSRFVRIKKILLIYNKRTINIRKEKRLKKVNQKEIIKIRTDFKISYFLALVEESTKEIVRRAAAAVGSLRDAEFDVRFNPDVFSPGVKHPDPNGPDLKKQKQLVKDAADFLLTMQLPTFVSSS